MENNVQEEKDNCDFVELISKNAPHGLITGENTKNKTVEIHTQDIKGIIYYIDSDSNVYAMNDILQNKTTKNSKIKKVDDIYSIDEFFN